MTAPDVVRCWRVRDAAPYECCVAPCWGGSPSLLVAGTQKGRRPPPAMGWGWRPSASPGIAPSADGALDDWGFRAVRGAGVSLAAASGYFARCGGRPVALPPGPLRFGQRAAGWQEVSARNFVSEQGPASPPYWMYGKKLGRSYGAKGPATPADTPVVSCPIEKIE